MRVSSSSDIIAPDSVEMTRRWLMAVRRYSELLDTETQTMWIGSAPGEERVGSQTVQFLSKENESLDLREQRLEKL